jgi:ERF superfamily protein
MQTSEQINELATALAKAQGEITGALKESENPFFSSKYADLAACWDACRKPLSANGLSIVQVTGRGKPVTIEWETKDQKTGEISNFKVETEELLVVTTLFHSSGQWIRSELPMIPRDASPQGIGSALTYGRRYGLTAMVGVAQMDDDGNAASGKTNGTHKPVERPQQVQKTPYMPPVNAERNEVEDEGRITDAIQELVEAAAEGRRVGIEQIWNEIKSDEFIATRTWNAIKARHPDHFRTIEETLRPKDKTARGPKPQEARKF